VFCRDTSPSKVDLDRVSDDADTPVPDAVREAERAMLAEQPTKTYVGPAGNLEFNERVCHLALGSLATSLRERISTIQTVGGCGALRLGAEVIRVANPQAAIHVSDPTWANHEPLIGTVGLPLQRYPYYDPATRGVAFERMLEHLEGLAAGGVLLLHACCHNPTGADLEPGQWSAIAEICERRGLLPFVDLAYQGLGDSLDADALGLRILAQRVPELLIAVSCSKNFGLYRERTGALVALAESAATAAAIATQQARAARRMYSMPPDHGAAIVRACFGIRACATVGTGGCIHDRPRKLRAMLWSARGAGPDLTFPGSGSGHVLLLGLDRPPSRAERAAPHLYAARWTDEHRGNQRRERRLHRREHPRPDAPEPMKLCPKVILEGTRLTHKTDIAFALNEHARVVGPRKYRYHSPLISAEWCAFTNFPWGRGLINFEPAEEALAMETYATWARLFELQRYYSWIVDRFHVSTIVYQRHHGGRDYDFRPA
jgi:aspartate aminotransferase